MAVTDKPKEAGGQSSATESAAKNLHALYVSRWPHNAPCVGRGRQQAANRRKTKIRNSTLSSLVILRAITLRRTLTDLAQPPSKQTRSWA